MKDEIKEKIKAYYIGNDIDKVLDCITNLQEENRQTKLLKERYQLEKEVYKSRNEKTIELLKHDMERYDLEDGYSTCEEALNILQGEDKDDTNSR